MTRWNDTTEAYVRAQLDEHKCPLCGGRTRIKVRRVQSENGWAGCFADYVETVCHGCGMVVDEEGSGFDGDF